MVYDVPLDHDLQDLFDLFWLIIGTVLLLQIHKSWKQKELIQIKARIKRKVAKDAR